MNRLWIFAAAFLLPAVMYLSLKYLPNTSSWEVREGAVQAVSERYDDFGRRLTERHVVNVVSCATMQELQ